jgi:hypothetical protein
MADDGKHDKSRPGEGDAEAPPERSDVGISERVRRAMAAGLEAASRSKEDLLRAAGSELGSWLERMDMTNELAKALTKLVVEVKAEIRFRPREDGSIVPEVVSSEVKNKPVAKP